MNWKKVLGGFLKFILPLGLGIFLVVWIYRGFSPADREEIKVAMLSADYRWVALSIFLGILSHLSRAHRWILMIRTMGHEASLKVSFYSVMIGYLANLAFPRAGEVSRCGAMAKSENLPFQHLFGTVIAERVIDLIILVSLTFFTFFLEREVLAGFMTERIIEPLQEKVLNGVSGLAWVGILGAVAVISVLVLKYVVPGLLLKAKNFLLGIFEGFKSIIRLKNPWLFAGHTLLIWSLYFLMYRICFFALGDVEHASLHAVLASFISGSFGIVATQGGIGAYHGLVAGTLVLYGLDFNDGYAFAWIAWAGQTVMILLTGFFSLIALPLVNKGNHGKNKRKGFTPATPQQNHS